MDFEYKERLSHPADTVYEIMRDRMDEVVPLVPNVESIRVLEREALDGARHRIINQWQGSPSATPMVLRPFIKPEMTRWIDYAMWHDAERKIEWRFETEAFKNAYACQGINYIEADGGGRTVVRLTGSFELYPENVPGVSKAMARKLAPTLEKWLLSLVSPNLSEAPRAVQMFLDQK